ncbi:MAG: hypothetical protein COA42_21650 [Alteromonadaceae bacterium]|nr:MAG: hypothetical protein COA42_21650 [Alteromonadaceae bacterium]
MTRTLKSIALVCPSHDKASNTVSDPLLQALIGQIGDVLSHIQCELIIASFPSGRHDWAEIFLESGRAEGIIVYGHGDFQESIDALVEVKAPFVVWGSTAAASRHCTVGSDNERGGYFATRHLLELGRRKIVFLGDKDLPEFRERFSGYVKALNEFKIEVDDALIVCVHPNSYSTFVALNHHLTGKNVKFDAVFASNDNIAIETITVLHKQGLHVPADVSVVGFGNSSVAAYCNPPLTSVVQDINFAAREIVARLTSIVKGEVTRSLRIPVKLLVRSSCTPEIEQPGKLTLSRHGMIEKIDKRAAGMLGYNISELVGKDIYYFLPDPELFEGELPVDFNLRDYRDGKKDGSTLQSIFIEHKTGNLLAMEIGVTCVKVEGTEIYHCILQDEVASEPVLEHKIGDFRVFSDQSAMTDAGAAVKDKDNPAAYIDLLTGLPNRTFLMRRLRRELLNAKKTQQSLALAIFNIDYFKAYNDNYGFVAADKSLNVVGKIIKSVFAQFSHIIARYGGDEFVVIIPEVDAERVVELVEHALIGVKERNIRHEYSPSSNCITLSAGVYYGASDKLKSVRKLIWLADNALFEAKDAGRDRLVLFD